ncbi:SDR family NAD(P)-dependent oxidoreductase [Prauserella oleivorans]|uniref:SDR family NAD(P)-dependent oxidoreductase n=1 Tax=Prauserella oleivorans TaxID=1478153 RepID=A0ABW5WCT0_9PSEU
MATRPCTKAPPTGGDLVNPPPGTLPDLAGRCRDQEARRRTRGMDVLVNNADIAAATRFAEVTAERWRHTMTVDLDGVFHCTHAALP